MPSKGSASIWRGLIEDDDETGDFAANDLEVTCEDKLCRQVCLVEVAIIGWTDDC